MRRVTPCARSTAPPELCDLVEVAGTDTVVDGELVVQRADGSTDFQALGGRLLSRRGGPSVTFIAFDLLVDRGELLEALPYVEPSAI